MQEGRAIEGRGVCLFSTTMNFRQLMIRGGVLRSKVARVQATNIINIQLVGQEVEMLKAIGTVLC